MEPEETTPPAEPAAEGEEKTKPTISIKILKYHAVARWTWGPELDGDVCGICQMPYEGCPPGVRFPGDGAPVVWGKCAHAFHLQCISQWCVRSNRLKTPRRLTTKNSCPICRQEWEFQSQGATEEKTQA